MALPTDVEEYSCCPAVIRSQLAARRERARTASVQAVQRDFLKHGSLHFAYTRVVLRRTLRRMPYDLVDYSYFDESVRSQLAAITDH